MKTLFFGTPALAVPFLELLAEQTELKGVVTTPDEPAGRGYEPQPSPVKEAALKLTLPVLQPARVSDPDFAAQLKALSPDIVFVVAYGRILPSAILKLAWQGFINVHFSLLPAYRGAAPIQRALMQGEDETGVTLFWLDEGMDTGPILLQKSLPIAEDDDAETLRRKLVELGLDGVRETLDLLSKGKAERRPQSGAASLAPSLRKEEGQIVWSKPAVTIANLIRGTYPWPGAFSFVGGADKTQRLKVLKAQLMGGYPGVDPTTVAGQVVGLESGKGFVVKCGQEFLHILLVQPEGKRPMSAWDFWQGARLKIGDKLG